MGDAAMRRFYRRIAICLTPLVLSAYVVARAYYLDAFHLGVDLVGGTILVYQVQNPSKLPPNYHSNELARALKRRIDPADLYNVIIRPVARTRVEIVLPTGGAALGRRSATAEYVEHVKSLIAQVGSLEFRILANDRDDAEAVRVGEEYLAAAQRQAELEMRARAGEPPPPPPPPDGQAFNTPKGNFTYDWFELGPQERLSLNLDNAAEYDPTRSFLWKQVAAARAQHKPYLVDVPDSNFLIFSRKCEDLKLPKKEREEKKYDYFVLTRGQPRNPVTNQPQPEITGQYLANATAGVDERLRPSVHFRFDETGGNLFFDLTSNNLPTGSDGTRFVRRLAIIVDGDVVSAPVINSAIRREGEITGPYTWHEVDDLATILRSGALPAALAPQPVSENSMGATLGSDTIRAGTLSVGIAFGAVLFFMLVYYRFAGLVACTALLANLLLTVGFLVAFNATFTLPGLAGLVLMLGMAVDANVLIYERLREERDRGASLALALRNGYDRAFPTIIDTHLSSIFTAVVLYIVGNDQLKGFGISLASGLVISLFTSLYMTRLIFDIWLYKGRLKKLSMFRLLSHPDLDFMSIRYYWFTATVLLTLFGIGVFIYRGPSSLNIDFTGGTAYGGQLVKPVDIETLRGLLGTRRQAERLAVAAVKPISGDERSFEITYRDGTKRKIVVPEPATPEEVKRRAETLPDLSVEQIFPNPFAPPTNTSRFFLVRASERAPELVQASIDQLLDGLLKKITLQSYQISQDHKEAVLTFSDYASPAQVSRLLKGNLETVGAGQQGLLFTLHGMSGTENQEGRFKEMRLAFPQAVDPAKLDSALKATQTELKAQPQPERLENFDSTFAAETQSRALLAILASWLAMVVYLWFRFSSWKFGMAALLCLVHDLFFTLGIIAFCHYLVLWAPAAAHALLIEDFKIDLPAVAALLTLVGYSVNDTIVVFDRIREVRGRDPSLTPKMINESVNQTLSRTLLTSFATWLVVIVLYIWGGEGIHLFAFVMVVGVIVGTYSSIYIASPLLLIFGEGSPAGRASNQAAATATE
jgi:SecD/SecF fusion protein